MSDPFLNSLREDWQSNAVSSNVTLRQLRRHRWSAHVMLAIEMVGCFAALLAGLWFAWVAMRVESNQLLFILSAAVLLLTAPALGIATFVTRRPGLQWDEATPERLLNTGIRRADASLRAIRVARVHLGVIAGFVVVLWIAEALQFIDARSFLVFYTVVCLIVGILAWFWFASRERRLRHEREACTRLLHTLTSTQDR